MNLDAGAAAHMLNGAAVYLLEWYDRFKRSMPWRDDPTPYHVWLSEIMLQQTRVEAVRDYYIRFLREVPDIEALARTDELPLLKLWEGLGYYSRAKNLRKAAQIVMRDYNGVLPGDYAELLTLPGIGAYTAGAIASIAFGNPVPAVDGNVLRVFSRLLAFQGDMESPAVKKACRQLAQSLIPPERPGDFNQALMELGAIVCLPNGAPQCENCPLTAFCEGYKLDVAAKLPVKSAKKERRIERRTILLAISREKILLFPRREGLLRGMYEPLNFPETLSLSQARERTETISPLIGEVQYLGPSIHIFTHVKWMMEGYLANLATCPEIDGGVWADIGELTQKYPVPSAFKAYMQKLRNILSSCIQ